MTSTLGLSEYEMVIRLRNGAKDVRISARDLEEVPQPTTQELFDFVSDWDTLLRTGVSDTMSSNGACLIRILFYF